MRVFVCRRLCIAIMIFFFKEIVPNSTTNLSRVRAGARSTRFARATAAPQVCTPVQYETHRETVCTSMRARAHEKPTCSVTHTRTHENKTKLPKLTKAKMLRHTHANSWHCSPHACMSGPHNMLVVVFCQSPTSSMLCLNPKL